MLGAETQFVEGRMVRRYSACENGDCIRTIEAPTFLSRRARPTRTISDSNRRKRARQTRLISGRLPAETATASGMGEWREVRNSRSRTR